MNEFNAPLAVIAGRIAEVTGADYLEFRFWNRSGIVLRKDGIDTGWRVRFSGRTKREAVIAGELPWVGSLYPSDIR